MRAVTILSFEHLMDTLAQGRRDGVAGYIGCCREAFVRKHYEDFRAAKLPGVLIDINDSTCYDLDQTRLAYRGEFEQQTQLELGVLEKVLIAACSLAPCGRRPSGKRTSVPGGTTPTRG